MRQKQQGIWTFPIVGIRHQLMTSICCSILAVIFADDVNAETISNYRVGAARADITSAVHSVGTLGYAAPVPKAEGLLSRLHARAFYFDTEDPSEGSASHPFAWVILEQCFVTQALKLAVVEELKGRGLSDFDESNLMLTATHTHSAPAGLSHHKFYNTPAKGLLKEHLERLTQGTADAIVQAKANRQAARIKMGRADLIGYSRQRSRVAYAKNPQEDRQVYPDDVDPTHIVFRIEDLDGRPFAAISLFSVHATSGSKDLPLLHGDNKGYAAWLWERRAAETRLIDSSAASRPDFVAAFGTMASGDASPNVAGDLDGDGDWDCPALGDVNCIKWSGTGQYEHALKIFESLTDDESRELHGELSSTHAFLDFSDVAVSAEYTGGVEDATTCPGAIGFSMLAGSEEDGPGIGKEGQPCSEGGPLTNLVCGLEKYQCQGQKPVARGTGYKNLPTTPNILPIQIVRLGDLALAGVPGELTTMSGRRIRASLSKTLASAGISEVLSLGYANAFSSYVATPEEYQVQHYEGASTLFGPWTLPGYQQSFDQLARRWLFPRSGESTQLGLGVEDLPKLNPKEVTLPMKRARARRGYDYGDLTMNPKASYLPTETVNIKWVAPNPHYDLMLEKGYFEISRFDPGRDIWSVVARDRDYETELWWKRRPYGEATLVWNIPETAQIGLYRILFRFRTQSGELVQKTSPEFQVVELEKP